MPITPSVQPVLHPGPTSEPVPIPLSDAVPSVDDRAPEAPRHERDARAEIDRLREEVERLVKAEGDVHARDTVDSALARMSRLQVVTANIDACKPPSSRQAGAAHVALADARLTGHPDAIERGMTYTADNQMRLLQNP
jgi:hypothetical protein